GAGGRAGLRDRSGPAGGDGTARPDLIPSWEGAAPAAHRSGERPGLRSRRRSVQRPSGRALRQPFPVGGPRGPLEAVMLRRISGLSARRPWLVVVLWLAVVGAGFGTVGGVFGTLVGDVGTVPGSESGRATRWLDDNAPRPEKIVAIVSGRPAS